jgi:hypothetical protein
MERDTRGSPTGRHTKKAVAEQREGLDAQRWGCSNALKVPLSACRYRAWASGKVTANAEWQDVPARK